MPIKTDPRDPVAADLETTAELPLIDFNAAAEPDETMAMFSASALPDLADSLRDVELHLKRKTERLRALEAELEAAASAENALREDLDRERRAASDQLAKERRSSAELLERERAASAEQLEHERRTSTAQLESERRSAVERLETLHQAAQAELADVRTTAQSKATELGQRLGGSEESLQQTRAAHQNAMAELAAVQGHLAERERLLAELRESTTRQATELRHQSRDLGELRQRAERQAEALSRSHGSQGVLTSLLAQHEQVLAEMETRHAQQMATTTAEAGQQLQQSIAREISMREEMATTAAATRSETERQLAELVSQHIAREAELTAERTASDASLKTRYEAQQAEARAAHAAAEQALQQELAALREESSQRIRTLDESLQRRTTELEHSLQQRTQELAESRSRADAAERTVTEQSARLESAQLERQGLRDELSVLRATDASAKAGVARFDEQRGQIEELELALAAAQQLAARLEADLAASRGSVQRLEADARARTSLLGSLQQNMARISREDSGVKPGVRVAASGSALPERVLIGQQDGETVMHPLGRRSTIGRTSDNQIQVEATHVSRHHAVILGSEQHCIIEDLNSTNGISVNGKRVARQMLNDGDIVKIGQSVFRFRQTS
jgi:chromosome segregation ATPase